MIAQAIALFISNLPLVFTVAAIICAATINTHTPWPQRYLSWILLLAVGATAVWGGLFHVFAPGIASAEIGWQPSPFEYEIGVSDIAMGIVAIIAFWRSLAFQSAIALFTILAYIGMDIGHFIQAFGHGNFSPDNFGILLFLTIAQVIGLSFLLWAAWRQPTVHARPAVQHAS
jgi:uncharacterized membrane protein